MTLTLTVLGCSGSYPAPGGACSGYLVRSPGATVVVDLGSGTLANLQRHVALDEIDALVLTHEHPDHWLDVPILRTALKYYLEVEGLAVYGTAGAHDAAGALIGELEPTLRWTTLDAGSEIEVGDQTFRFSRTDHPVETLAVRIESGGRSLAYTADTGAAWTPGDFLEGADLLLCEATLTEAQEGRTQHLSARQAATLAQSANIEHLVLTHIAPTLDGQSQRSAAQTTFPGPVDVADIGKSFIA